ncbi:HEAT repeat domain-containing protein [Rhodococcus sp. 14-1411-2a]|uniref:HEAT repeat domain-containing protein n=1 Tax=Rhodococcus sp. 14-1411-2a TaxID=2023151 RepID=UPI0015C5F694|nr:HEAT repeat domain-containing protein [Rhodococcus sp. 14-1411-2a]
MTVRVSGREPLTSRPVRITGQVVGGTLDGYLRYLVIREENSNVEYWIAGSNATRSVAVLDITFALENSTRELLLNRVHRNEYVPGLMNTADHSSEWEVFEKCMASRTDTDLGHLLDLLENPASHTLHREVALGIRAFARVAQSKRSLQRQTERRLLQALGLDRYDDDTRIAIVENLGYVGSSSSLCLLGNLVEKQDEVDHVRWAAATALGRLNLSGSVPFLISGIASTHAWTRAAALLGLSRRIDERDRPEVEPMLAGLLTADDQTVRRYACLAISRFSSVQDDTSSLLLDIIESLETTVALKGYAALAMSSVISSCSERRRQRCETVLSGLVLSIRAELSEPETVWGLEFLAELSTLVELHEVAEELYSELTELFDDWRGGYYDALSLYERGESEVQIGGDELPYYRSALETLRAIETNDSQAKQAVLFRIDIVEARLGLQEAIRDWQNTFDPGQLLLLERHVRGLAAVFARYSSTPSPHQGVKRLSERERDYLVGTKRLVEVLAGTIALEATWRRGTANETEIRALLRNLTDVLRVVAEQFRGQLARGPLALASDAYREAEETLGLLENATLAWTDRERGLAPLTSELRRLFGTSTWPMPARACPISGLGRGDLTVLAEDIPGAGTVQNPYMFPSDAPAVVNLIADIHEMAPGGATRARLECEVAGSRQAQTIHAVEGPVRCDFVLPRLTPLSSAVCKFELIFEARDCTQVSAREEVYVRRQNDSS